MRGDASDELYREFGVHRSVVLMHSRSGETETPLDLLETMSSNSSLVRRIRALTPDDAELIENGGGGALISFEEAQTALDFSLGLYQILASMELPTRIGIDRGLVMLIPVHTGGWRIAGHPVNLASKQAEDFGEIGKIYLTDRAAEGLTLPSNHEKYETTISGVTIKGIVVDGDSLQ